MTSPMFALCLTFLFLGEIAQTTNVKSLSAYQESSFVSATTGDNVTLLCSCEKDVASKFHWYKQTLGQIPRLMSTYYKYKSATFHNEFENNPRFSLDTDPGKNHLKITNLQVSDSATYFCACSYSYVFEFAESITLSVKDSGVNVKTVFHHSVSIQSGGSVTLNCTVHTPTCDGEHSVYWFRDSGESHSGLIYTNGGKNDQCERNQDTQTNSCVYELPMGSVNPSHAGMYYCAVASCGHILFGDRTTVDIEDDEHFRVMVKIFSGAFTFIVILIVLLPLVVCRMRKSYSECQARLAASSLTNAEVYQVEDRPPQPVLTKDNKEGAKRRKRDDTWSECVYFQLKQ